MGPRLWTGAHPAFGISDAAPLGLFCGTQASFSQINDTKRQTDIGMTREEMTRRTFGSTRSMPVVFPL